MIQEKTNRFSKLLFLEVQRYWRCMVLRVLEKTRAENMKICLIFFGIPEYLVNIFKKTGIVNFTSFNLMNLNIFISFLFSIKGIPHPSTIRFPPLHQPTPWGTRVKSIRLCVRSFLKFIVFYIVVKINKNICERPKQTN